MKSGVEIVLKIIKNYEKSLKLVFLDIFNVLMWLIFEILQQVFELFFLSPKHQLNRFNYRNSFHKKLGLGSNQSLRACLSSLTTATDSISIKTAGINAALAREGIKRLH